MREIYLEEISKKFVERCLGFPKNGHVARLQSLIVCRSSSMPSVNGCNQSGKESPPAFAAVDWCLVDATNGTWFSDVHSFVGPHLRCLFSCFPRISIAYRFAQESPI